MADNTHFPDRRPLPFRRYTPTTSHNHRAENRDRGESTGQVMPFPNCHQASAPAKPVAAPAPSQPRRGRRNPWRPLAVKHTASQPNPARSRQQTPLHQTSQPVNKRFRPAQKPPQQPYSPPQGDYSPSQPPASVRAMSANYPSQNPAGQEGARVARQPAPQARFSSKVTPLHRRSRRAPQTVFPSRHPVPPTPQRGRKPARSSGRPAPRPVLYGLRLLIVGTGIAALVGTLLSTLKPESQGTAIDRPSVGIAQNPTSQSRQRGGQVSLATTALPLTEEIVHLETDLLALEAMTPGLSQSVFFYDLDTGEYLDLNGTEAVSAASTLKVPILVAFLEAIDNQTLNLNQALTLREDLLAGGSGEMQTQAIGSQYTAWEVATEMIIRSDNTATNMLIELLGGQATLNQQFQRWGLPATVIRNALPDLDGTNTTSPADLVRLLALIDQGEILSGRSRDRLFSIMHRTHNRTLIPDGLRDETALAFNKTGDIGRALADVALVDVANGKRYIVSISVARPDNDGRASELIRRVAGRIHAEISHPITPVGQSVSPVPSSVPAPAPETSSPGNALETTSPLSTGGQRDQNPNIPRG